MPSGMFLLPGEKVVYYGRKSYLSELGMIILGFILLPVFGIGLIVLLIVFLRVYGTEYCLTNRRFYVKYGLIARRVHETWLESITDTNFFQTFLGRAFDFGTIVVHTAGMNNPQFTYVGVERPKYVISYLRNAIEWRNAYLNYSRRLEKMEDEYFMGKITREQYLVAKGKLAKKYGIIKPKKKKVKSVRKRKKKVKKKDDKAEDFDVAFEI